MVIKNAELVNVVGVTTKKLPDTGLPEIAFAGRSNVGKSSLINVLLQRKALARTSSTPGKTQTMNFYKVNDDVCFVDLPGYGYAHVKTDFRRSWGPMIERYLRSSGNLKAVFLLIDIRRVPNEDDSLMYEWIVNAGFTPVIIVTKADKVKRSQTKKAVLDIKNALRVTDDTEIFLFSAMSKSGREEIMEKIDSLAEEEMKDNDKD
ncbi:MAG: YihA family ribosome biogenesis GTP-binding protein [Lachnospiraceae bacterium]|nr:YihA family ribosome biogenesis GTP-binding protein [Lachnospiraceae bacterium]MBQ9607634.1 YihA family ribosome biogenesis GTP-binding protein [Lachnospiraceae bacterium]